MASEISTIQSLKAVDAWIDVINANINGGVRTAFKSSRLKFAGSNVDVSRAGSSTSLPLQFPESGLTTANTVIDFSQGAVTASTENTHLAIQGEGFFILGRPDMASAAGAFAGAPVGERVFLFTRDGEFRTNKDGLLVNKDGWFLMTGGATARCVYNNLDLSPSVAMTAAVRLSDYLAISITAGMVAGDGTTPIGVAHNTVYKVTGGRQSIRYTQFGSTVFDFGHRVGGAGSFPEITYVPSTAADCTVLTKSLEASNASMTQSVPELSLAQKLFSALTKVLQTKQTNVDGVLNLVR